MNPLSRSTECALFGKHNDGHSVFLPVRTRQITGDDATDYTIKLNDCDWIDAMHR